MAASEQPLPRTLNPVIAIGRWLPRGWPDFLLQLAIFATFDVAYELSRAVAQGQRATALRHARDVVSAERSLGLFHELAVQQWATSSAGIVLDVANWTYFNCQFTISFCFLLWVYARRNDSWSFVRNTIIAADFIGFFGYILYPTAPPRMLPDLGFVDTLSHTAVNHRSSGIADLANPYAAMPSLHTAYAIMLGLCGVILARHQLVKAVWAIYPGVVVFSIVATANHFFLDAVAGAGVLVLALGISTGVAILRRRRPHHPPLVG